MKTTTSLIVLSLAIVARLDAQTFTDAFGPKFATPQSPINNIQPLHHFDDPLHRWNQIAIDASGLDHTPVAPGESRTFGEQLGPGRSARAMAIVHIAMFDVVNAVHPKY